MHCLCGRLMAIARQPQFYLAAALRRARTEAGRTQEDLARAIGMEPSEISALESGRRSPHLKTAKRLTDGLGVPCWQVMRLAEELECGTPWEDITWPPPDQASRAPKRNH